MKRTYIFSLALLIILGGACSDDDDNGGATPTTSDEIRFTDPSNSGGCVDFQLYHYSDNREYGLLLSGNTDSLGLTTDWQDFTVSAADTLTLALELFEFSQPVEAFFCDDLVEAQEDPIQEWNATEGTVRLRITEEANELGLYRMDALLEDVVVNGQSIDRLEFNGVEVGAFPG